MTGRVCVVTGSNSGIGFHIAKYLAEGGNDVILACRDKEKANDARRKIKLQFPNALVECMHVSLACLNLGIYVCNMLICRWVCVVIMS